MIRQVIVKLLRSYRHRLSLHLVLVAVLEGLGRVLPPVHADEGAAARRDEFDRLDGAELTEHVGQVVIADKFRKMTDPQGGAAN